MKSSVKNISLTSVDDIFKTEETRQDELREKVMDIPLEQLHPFPNHPFKVLDNEDMVETVASVKTYGVLIPAIARPREDGEYEIIAGHRRHRASELSGLDTMPVIVRDLDDETATIIMVDSNLQRETLLPSERAFAYKMKLDAIKKTAGRPTKENSRQLVGNLASADIIGKETGESGRQVQRFIRLTELVPTFLDMVDNKQIGMTPAVEISYLTHEQQTILLDVMDAEQTVPSLSQAQRIKSLAKDGICDFNSLSVIMKEEKKSDLDKVSISSDKIKKYFPKSYTPQKMEETIIKLLENWHKKRIQQQER